MMHPALLIHRHGELGGMILSADGIFGDADFGRDVVEWSSFKRHRLYMIEARES
jgi:hypothetical protein